MLLQTCFKHFLKYVGSLLAVVTVTVDGGKFAYRAVQQSGGRSRGKRRDRLLNWRFLLKQRFCEG